MRRLRKLNDAARLHDINIDPQTAMSAIATNDSYFKQENIIKDSAASRYAFWGVISDDGKYLVEAYVYNVAQNQRKCAYVIAPIMNNNGSYTLGNPEVVIYNIESTSEIRSRLSNGLSMGGTKLTFNNEYANMDEIEQLEQPDTTMTARLKNKR